MLLREEAEQKSDPQIRSEHLLLGLLREEKKGIIASLLDDLGTSVEVIRTKLLARL